MIRPQRWRYEAFDFAPKAKPVWGDTNEWNRVSCDSPVRLPLDQINGVPSPQVKITAYPCLHRLMNPILKLRPLIAFLHNQTWAQYNNRLETASAIC